RPRVSRPQVQDRAGVPSGFWVTGAAVGSVRRGRLECGEHRRFDWLWFRSSPHLGRERPKAAMLAALQTVAAENRGAPDGLGQQNDGPRGPVTAPTGTTPFGAKIEGPGQEKFAMTETEWLAHDGPPPLLAYVAGRASERQ